jgi:hypothetical protein
MRTTTTLGHNARSNGMIEVFWQYWNRCMNRKPSTGILATGCRLTTSSSILDIQLLPMMYSCPVVS